MSCLDCKLRDARAEGRLVVQPRMGFPSPITMRRGLAAVASTVPHSVGTITVDAYTRVGREECARRALAAGDVLNGYPITVHSHDTSANVLDGILTPDFPVQVRHGSPDPRRIFGAAAALGLLAIEGGPVSYNLPYSRARLADTVAFWREALRFWAGIAEKSGSPTHVETFGGCMLGQMCPPSLLVAISVLEAKFTADLGIPSVSLSLAQGTSSAQDIGSLLALEALSGHYVPNAARHTVFYTHMGLFPETEGGARALIEDSARIARIGGAARLVAKTAAEARAIPTIEENVTALLWAREAADAVSGGPHGEALAWANRIAMEAQALIDTTIGLDADLGCALIAAFDKGVLDVPYCIHPENRGRSRATVDPETGALAWTDVGDMPLPTYPHHSHASDADDLEAALSWVRCTYDAPFSSSDIEEPST